MTAAARCSIRWCPATAWTPNTPHTGNASSPSRATAMSSRTPTTCWARRYDRSSRHAGPHGAGPRSGPRLPSCAGTARGDEPRLDRHAGRTGRLGPTSAPGQPDDQGQDGTGQPERVDRGRRRRRGLCGGRRGGVANRASTERRGLGSAAVLLRRRGGQRHQRADAPARSLSAMDRPAPDTATCVSVGVYAGALTFGNEYAILTHDADKGQVEVRGDNGRKRWFPSYCFDLTGQPVVK